MGKKFKEEPLVIKEPRVPKVPKHGYTHQNLVDIGAKFLMKANSWKFRMPYVITEFSSYCSESPDVFGLNGARSLLIEVKISRNDFKADAKKPFRKGSKPELGIGSWRYYMCPRGMIAADEVKGSWGLMYVYEDGKVGIIKESGYFEKRNFIGELQIMQSVIRRLAGTRKILNFSNTNQ